MDVMAELRKVEPSKIKKFITDAIRKFTGKKKKKKKNGTAKEMGGEVARGIDALARIRNRTKLPN